MSWFRLYRAALLLGMLAVSAAIAAGFFGWFHPAFDTISNFRAHLGVVLVLMAALWSLKCGRVPAFVFAIGGFLTIVSAAPGLPATSYAALPGGEQETYRLFSMNLYWNNQRPKKVLNAIRKSRPDILTLSEVSSIWRRRLGKLHRRYPYRYRCPEHGTLGGTMIFSRFPKHRDNRFCGEYGSLALAEFEIAGEKIAIGSVHLRWPWPASGPRQIDMLTPQLSTLGGNAVIAGDFNSVTWSYSVARFAQAGKLQIVKGIGPTWSPSLTIFGKQYKLLNWLGLPIDNVMAKGSVQVYSARTLRDAGSDHLPILVEFTLR